MELNDIFSSDSLKATDLRSETPVTIESCEVKDFDDGSKIILRFVGADKSLICNKTNARTIADMYGTNTDGWVGKVITLFPTQTDYNGRQVACIRVKLGPPTSEPATVRDSEAPF